MLINTLYFLVLQSMSQVIDLGSYFAFIAMQLEIYTSHLIRASFNEDNERSSSKWSRSKI